MRLKHRAALFFERQVNKITRTFGLRVLFLAKSTLHEKDVSFRADGLITSHNVNFLNDDRFNLVLNSIREEVDHPLYHEFRIYMAIKLAEHSKQVPNSIFVECGVGEGVMMLAINRYFPNEIPKSYLIDTFEGIDPKYLTEAEFRGGASTKEEMRDTALKSYRSSDFESVSERFQNHANINLIKGTIPDILEDKKEIFNNKKISFLHIDMNNAYPEVEALKFFYDKLSVPAFVLLDDYSSKDMPIQKQSIDKVCCELGLPQPISLPTGQGLIIKFSERNL